MWKYLQKKLKKNTVAPLKPSHPKVAHATPADKTKTPPPKPQLNNNIKHIIAIASGKGGVGKSTVCSNLALALSEKGHKVGVLDADIYGPSQAVLLGNTQKAKGEDGALLPLESHGVKFISMSSVNPKGGAIIVRAPVATRAVNQFLTDVRWGDLDYLLVDLPPGTGDIPLSLAQKTTLSGVIIVTTPQSMATDIAAKSLLMFQKVNVPILGVIENMSTYICQSCGEINTLFKDAGGVKIAKDYDVPLLGNIPMDPAIITYSEQGKSLIKSEPEHLVSQMFITIVEKVQKVLLSS